jgi:TPR repeat protein
MRGFKAAILAASMLAVCPAMAQRLDAPKTQSAASLQPAYAAVEAGDYARAHKLAGPLAEKGDAAAMALMGYLYENGFGASADIARALRFYGDAAIKGDADAQIALGDLALQGDEVIADYERAAGWYRLAAAQGDARAHVKLGVMYADGVGVLKNDKAAATHFARAAGLGDADGAFMLGVAYLNGAGLSTDAKEGVKFLKIAAGKGHGEASYQLALLYDGPALGKPDPKAALRFMTAAAKAGFPPAYAGMGLFAHRGDAPGVPADWFELAARSGEPQGALLYAVALSKGDGRPKDEDAALKIADLVAASPDAAPATRAQAARLKRDLERNRAPALTLRD